MGMKIEFNYDTYIEAASAFEVFVTMKETKEEVELAIFSSGGSGAKQLVQIGDLHMKMEASGIIAPYFTVTVEVVEVTNRWDNA